MSWITSRSYVLPADADAFSNGHWFNLWDEEAVALQRTRTWRYALLVRVA